jgi:Domain of unknown function (DUF6265)
MLLSTRIAIRASLVAIVATFVASHGLDAQSASPSSGTSSAAATARVAATTADFAWLTGTWKGSFEQSPTLVAEIAFQAPRAGTLTGVMRLVEGDKLLIIELISLVDTPRGVEMRFRHFDGELTAMETTYKQAMLLKSHEATKDTFENLFEFDKALMSTQPRVSSWTRRGPDDMIAHSDIIGGNGSPSVIEVLYHRTSPRDPRHE